MTLPDVDQEPRLKAARPFRAAIIPALSNLLDVQWRALSDDQHVRQHGSEHDVDDLIDQLNHASHQLACRRTRREVPVHQQHRKHQRDTTTVLQNCASSPDKFYMLTSSTQIVTTFNTIGTALSKLRVSQ